MNAILMRLFIVLLTATISHAQAQTSLTGTWTGAIETPAVPTFAAGRDDRSG